MINKDIVRIFDVPMHAWSMDDTVRTVNERLEENCFTQHVVVNVAKLINMQSDPVLAESVTSCDIVNIDGAGVVAGGRILGLKIPERDAGADLFCRLLQMSAEHGYPVFLLGARDEVVKEARIRVERQYPELIVAGHHHGYFWDDEEAVVNKIHESGARLLFVAITSPK